jgi:hypothetical protein
MFKKILFSLFITVASFSMTTTVQSCSSPLALTAANVSTIASKIGTILGAKLGLNAIQSPLVSGLVGEFLKGKVNLSSLMKANPAQYASQLSSIQGLLMNGMKSGLAADQVTKFLGLKPATNDPKNLLSQLFY